MENEAELNAQLREREGFDDLEGESFRKGGRYVAATGSTGSRIHYLEEPHPSLGIEQ